MKEKSIQYSDKHNIEKNKIINLYKLNNWSSSDKPDLLYKALINSHSLITAWDKEELVGLGNAISDGFLVVYYPHLLVLPEYQGMGIGKNIVKRLTNIYANFHQQILVSENQAIGFYERCGFQKADNTESMWIYQDEEDWYLI
ncbi:MAG: GNAT family N-acetyltransferase [Mastigocoleus sp.]